MKIIVAFLGVIGAGFWLRTGDAKAIASNETLSTAVVLYDDQAALPKVSKDAVKEAVQETTVFTKEIVGERGFESLKNMMFSSTQVAQIQNLRYAVAYNIACKIASSNPILTVAFSQLEGVHRYYVRALSSLLQINSDDVKDYLVEVKEVKAVIEPPMGGTQLALLPKTGAKALEQIVVTVSELDLEKVKQRVTELRSTKGALAFLE
jgi:hypothetical protein